MALATDRDEAHMRTFIENGTVVTATETVMADVVIEDERVAAIGVDLGVTAERPRRRRIGPEVDDSSWGIKEQEESCRQNWRSSQRASYGAWRYSGD